MTFEEWWETYEASSFTYVQDLKEAYEAGWNACAYIRSDDTYGEVMERKNLEETKNYET